MKDQRKANGLVRARTVILAVGAVAIFWQLGLPLPFLFGPIVSGLVIAILGFQVQGLGVLAKVARTVIGVSAGSAITPEVFARLPSLALSLSMIPVFVVTVGLVAYPYFRWICGHDRPTAFFCAMPGGLQDMIAFGEEAGANIRALSLIQATRVMLVVTAVPLVISLWFGVNLHGEVGLPAADVAPEQLVLIVTVAALGWWGAVRLRLFGASIVGPMLLGGALSVCGVLQARPPSESILLAQFLIGLGVGAHYVGISARELRSAVLAGFFYVLGLVLLATAMAVGLSKYAGVPALTGFLSFAPGGQAEMAVLALVTGADVGVVVIHHIARVTIIVIGAPLVAAFLRDKS
jgi:hypothetical protein